MTIDFCANIVLFLYAQVRTMFLELLIFHEKASSQRFEDIYVYVIKFKLLKNTRNALALLGVCFLHYENIFLGHFLFNFSPYGSAPNQGISSSIFFSLFVSMSRSFSRRYVMYFSESSPFMTAVLRTENMLADA